MIVLHSACSCTITKRDNTIVFHSARLCKPTKETRFALYKRVQLGTCEGKIKKKSINEAYGIIKDVISNTYHYSSRDRHVARRLAKVYQEHAHFILPPHPTCGQCETPSHEGKNCQMGNFFTKAFEEANFIS
ncbi:hypothetical protein CR513_55991, partial [Mucuna pruriens]